MKKKKKRSATGRRAKKAEKAAGTAEIEASLVPDQESTSEKPSEVTDTPTGDTQSVDHGEESKLLKKRPRPEGGDGAVLEAEQKRSKLNTEINDSKSTDPVADTSSFLSSLKELDQDSDSSLLSSSSLLSPSSPSLLPATDSLSPSAKDVASPNGSKKPAAMTFNLLSQ